jgi:spore coat polysaccharide biosynthesis protein SpsF (cytidylyltransferase family)
MDSNIAILLARLDSQRLPRKHFQKIGDDFLIDHCLKGLKKKSNYKIVLATSNREIDKPLLDWAKKNNIESFAGDAFDIKKRIKDCVQHYKASSFARVNADSPFIDAQLISDGFTFLNNNYDYDLYTNLYPRSYPYGYSVEVFSAQTFVETIINNTELENISTHFYNNAHLFKIKNITNTLGDFSKLKLTVDTPEDLEYIRGLYNKNPDLFNLNLQELATLINKTT